MMQWIRALLVAPLLVAVALAIRTTTAAAAANYVDLPAEGKSTVAEIDLNGPDWMVYNASSDPIPATVPGTVHKALLDAGVIPDIYYRTNDLDYAWVGKSDWTYQKTSFLAPAKTGGKALLFAEGLDTISTVLVNGKAVGTSDNMFRRYVFDVTSALYRDNKRPNSLVVQFTSADSYANSKAAAYPYPVPTTPYTDNNGVVFGNLNRNFIRKEQCSFGWDWGPSTATQGVWRPIKLVDFSEAYMSEFSPIVSPATKGTTDSYVVRSRVVLQSVAGASGKITVTLALNNGIPAVTKTVATGTLQDGENVIDVPLVVPKGSFNLWWPNEVGPSTRSLYKIRAQFVGDKTGEASFKEANIGFRTIEVVQEPVPGEDGLSFYFRINGVPTFIKGANFIPMDSLEDRVTRGDLEWILSSATEAHMSMLRVWGGGVYQSDDFYELLDQYGLMAWSDIMFACAMYPRDEDFLKTVRQEVVDNVRHISWHASVAVWAANNENEGALTWYPQTQANRDLYAADYTKLYIDTVRPALLQEDSSRPFTPSSPSNMALVDQGSFYVMRWGNAQDQRYGDVHFYDYASDCWDSTKFPRPRFASEYGFQSMPSVFTWRNATEEGDLSWNSPVMIKRQHHPNGQAEMQQYVSAHFTWPSSNLSPVAQFDAQCYLSQIAQSLCLRSETEHYRRIQSEQGHTMGTMYWQLNDIWQGPTWASIEHPGTWKLTHNIVKNFYSPFLVSPYSPAADTLAIYVVNDNWKPLSGQLTISFYSWATGTAISQTTASFSVGGTTSANSFSGSISALIGKASVSDGVFLISAADSQGNTLAVNVPFFPCSLSQAKLARATVKISSVAVTGNSSATLTVVSDQLAAFVYVQSQVPGRFDDNGFFLLPGEEKEVEFVSKFPFDGSSFEDSLAVRSLSDTL